MDEFQSRIKPLPKELIAKIAAGEVITSPINVVKELIENSLDAKATLIHVSIKDKGTYIKVKDNGTGFNKDDLPLACVRHTTSKLFSMKDFETLENYGFRGEALSSISQVADVTITSKKANELMGAQATYKDGKMISCKNIAANDGTVVIIKNLFNNMRDRQSNLISTFVKEFNKIVEVIQCYAIHCNFCSFQLEKDLRTEIVSNLHPDRVESIRTVLGRKIASNLLEVKYDNPKYEYSFEGLISDSNANLNRYFFILFINNRLVDCLTLKTAIKEIFSDQLMKGNNPFVYLNLKILQKNIDVNLHPSKREVRYLNEDLINSEISCKIQQCLVNKAENQDVLKVNSSFNQSVNKSFENSFNLTNANHLLSPSIGKNQKDAFVKPNSTPVLQSNSVSKNPNYIYSEENSDQKAKKVMKAAYKIVRNDCTSKKVTDMFAIKKMTEGKVERETRLQSVLNLRAEVDQNKDIRLTSQMRKTTLVGILDHRRILVQHEEFLNMLDFYEFSKAFFYQQFLKNFGNFKYINFEKDLHLVDLLLIYKEQMGTSEEFDVEDVVSILIDKREMYEDYFSMKITNDGFLKSIPIIIDGYKPNLNLLPLLIWNLSSINYQKEQSCFKMIGEAFAIYFSRPLDDFNEHKNNIKNIFSRFKEQSKPSKELISSIKPMANLQNLYKIFERC